VPSGPITSTSVKPNWTGLSNVNWTSGGALAIVVPLAGCVVTRTSWACAGPASNANGSSVSTATTATCDNVVDNLRFPGRK